MIETVLIVTIILLLFIWVYRHYKKHYSNSQVFYVGTIYDDIIFNPFKDSFFKGIEGQWHHTSDYIKVKLTENIDEYKKDDLLLIDPTELPIKGSLVLFEKEGQYRIAKCIADGRPSLPMIFDGHETPGIGYDLLGVVKYHKNNILKELKL